MKRSFHTTQQGDATHIRKKSIIPSAEEQLVLQQTSILAKENLASMQVNALLEEVEAKHVYKNAIVEDFLNSFITSLKDKSQFTDSKISPNIATLLDVDKSLDCPFVPPKSIQSIGSYDLQTMTAPYLNLDISITIPNEYFQQKDFLNFTYHKKRAFYVAYILQYLSTSTTMTTMIKSESLQVIYFKGDLQKPMIQFIPNINMNKLKNKNTVTHPLYIRLYFAINTNVFDLDRFTPNKNNITTLYHNLSSLSPCLTQFLTSTQDIHQIPTPVLIDPVYYQKIACCDYNMSILEDMAIMPQYGLIKTVLDTIPAARNGLILLKIWLTQVSARWSIENIDGYLIALLLAYCIQTRRINTHTTAFQIFQIMIQYLAETNLLDHRTHFLTFQQTHNSSKNDTKKSGNTENTYKYSSYFTIGLLHPLIHTTTQSVIDYNCLWRIQESCYLQLQVEAKYTKSILSEFHETTIQEIFLKKKSFYQYYDIYYHLPIYIPSFASIMKPFTIDDSTIVNHNILHMNLSIVHKHVYNILKKALPQGDRVHMLSTTWCMNTSDKETITSNSTITNNSIYSSHIHAKNIHSSSNTPTTTSAATSDVMSIVIGIVLNNEHAHRKVDRGPPPLVDNTSDNTHSIQSLFKRFWGPKCELRRFKDDSIVEALIWETPPPPTTITTNTTTTTTSTVGSGSATGRKQKQGIQSKGEQVIESIIQYILGYHLPYYCGHHGELITSVTSRLEQILPCEDSTTTTTTIENGHHKDATVQKKSSTAAATASSLILTDPRIINTDYMTMCQQVITTIDKLRKIITSDLKNIPLIIDNLISYSPCTGYTSLYPPIPHPFLYSLDDQSMKRLLSGHTISTHITPIVLHGIFGHSGKWPDDTEARIQTVTAFIVHISEQLYKQFRIRSISHPEFLDIIMDGFVYRMYLHPQQAPQSVNDQITTYPCDINEVEYDVIMVYHHQALRALQSHHTSYSKSIRLLTQWVHGHCYTGHIQIHTLELLCASVYLNPDGHRAPTSPTSAFILTLKRLLEWDLQTGPMIVNFDPDTDSSALSNVLTDLPTHITHLKNSFNFICQYGSSMNMRVLRYDTSCESMVYQLILQSVQKTVTHYFKSLETIPRVYLLQVQDNRNRMTNIQPIEIQSNMTHIHSLLYDHTLIQKSNIVLHFIDSIFYPAHKYKHTSATTTCITDCISLSALCKGPTYANMRMFANLSIRDMDIRNTIIRNGDHGPCHFQYDVLNQLRKHFGSYAVFFWNGNHGQNIGLVWRPKTFLGQTFSVLQSRYKTVIENNDGNSEKDQLVLMNNTSEILANMIDISDGFISDYSIQ